MTYTLLYDPELRRPACLLWQVMANCDAGDLRRLGFKSHTWLEQPTPGMKKLVGTEEQWRKVACDVSQTSEATE